MRSKLIAAVAAAALMGGAALAQDRPAGNWEEGQIITVGGEKKCVCKKPAKKVKAPEPAVQEEQPATGGSGELTAPEPAPLPPPAPEVAAPPPEPAPAPPAFAEPLPPPPPPKKHKAPVKGVTVSLGGGAEGYTGQLAPQIKTGAAYGVNLGYRPLKMLGFEVGYSGAANELRHFNASGVDMVRNGGNALALVGLAPSRIQPYVMGGVGISHYDFRTSGIPFRNDTAGQAPIGGGLRTQFGKVTADLRGSYNFLFSDNFALNTAGGGGQYTGTLNLGGTF